MSAIIRNYFAMTVDVDGSPVAPFGSLSEPMGEATIGGDHIGPAERMSIEPEDYIILWETSYNKRKFQELAFRIIDEGTLYVWVMTDLPTSSTDYTPLGTRIRWFNEVVACNLNPWIRQQRLLSIAAIADEVADDSGLPQLMTTDIATAVTSIIRKVVLYNPDTTDVVKIEKFFAQ